MKTVTICSYIITAQTLRKFEGKLHKISRHQKILGRGGQCIHYFSCVDGSLRLQKNLGLGPRSGRNGCRERCFCKNALIWAFYIIYIEKMTNNAYFSHLEHENGIFDLNYFRIPQEKGVKKTLKQFSKSENAPILLYDVIMA